LTFIEKRPIKIGNWKCFRVALKTKIDFVENLKIPGFS